MVADSGASRGQIHGRRVKIGYLESLAKTPHESVEQSPRKLAIQVELLQGLCCRRAADRAATRSDVAERQLSTVLPIESVRLSRSAVRPTCPIDSLIGKKGSTRPQIESSRNSFGGPAI